VPGESERGPEYGDGRILEGKQVAIPQGDWRHSFRANERKKDNINPGKKELSLLNRPRTGPA